MVHGIDVVMNPDNCKSIVLDGEKGCRGIHVFVISDSNNEKHWQMSTRLIYIVAAKQMFDMRDD